MKNLKYLKTNLKVLKNSKVDNLRGDGGRSGEMGGGKGGVERRATFVLFSMHAILKTLVHVVF